MREKWDKNSHFSRRIFDIFPEVKYLFHSFHCKNEAALTDGKMRNSSTLRHSPPHMLVQMVAKGIQPGDFATDSLTTKCQSSQKAAGFFGIFSSLICFRISVQNRSGCRSWRAINPPPPPLARPCYRAGPASRGLCTRPTTPPLLSAVAAWHQPKPPSTRPGMC